MEALKELGAIVIFFAGIYAVLLMGSSMSPPSYLESQVFYQYNP